MVKHSKTYQFDKPHVFNKKKDNPKMATETLHLMPKLLGLKTILPFMYFMKNFVAELFQWFSIKKNYYHIRTIRAL